VGVNCISKYSLSDFVLRTVTALFSSVVQLYSTALGAVRVIMSRCALFTAVVASTVHPLVTFSIISGIY
jgi:hypothetical protein